jgi:hypothetical protein
MLWDLNTVAKGTRVGRSVLGCEEVDRLKACKDRSCKARVEELAPRVGTARCRLEKAPKAGWCRNTQMVRDRGCGFIRGMDGFKATMNTP